MAFNEKLKELRDFRGRKDSHEKEDV